MMRQPKPEINTAEYLVLNDGRATRICGVYEAKEA